LALPDGGCGKRRQKESRVIKSITPFLWFDDQAEEAMRFYVSLFPGSNVVSVQPGGPNGKAFTVEFELMGRPFTALNAGPMYKFTEAFSMFVSVETQAEVDDLWSKLTADGGEESHCGWLKDRWGLSWQIIPTALTEMLGHPDREKADRAMQAMLQMQRIDIAGLRKAFEGR
jgi:predicted 3-demethylubiquinone-9 3-methyltransferase (glyoxalase superfamily)